MKVYVKIMVCLMVVSFGFEDIHSEIGYENSGAVINSMPETATARQQFRKLEYESLRKITDKENSLYRPIYAQVNVAIATIAKANTIKVVLDSSTGIVLHADQRVDLTNKAVAKLKQN